MHKSGFYPRLALTNILRNGQFFLPYFLTCTGTAAMFYILCFLTYNKMIDQMPGAGSLQMILYLGCIVVGLFSIVLLAYTNGFLMKRRRRELGLYNILGMEKRHIARLLCCEGALLGAGSIVCGLAAGILLSKLILMLLLKLVRFSVPMGFSVSGMGVLNTVLLFAAIFLGLLLFNLARIHLSSPVELLHSDAVGEREPKTKRALTVIGLITLSGGYAIANVVKDPLSALALFFVAVLLVIIGTYCLFTAGSIALLKHLRARKAYYYRPAHFTAVSGLLYRMKQNAVGLASICILSTMVLVTVSTTVCLYLGVGDALAVRYPADITVSYALPAGDDGQAAKEVKAAVEQTLKRSGRTDSGFRDYTDLLFTARLSGNTLVLDSGNGYSSQDAYRVLILMTAGEYSRLTGKHVTLAQDEVLSYTKGDPLPQFFYFQGASWRISQRLTAPPVSTSADAYLTDVQYLVVADNGVLKEWNQAQQTAYGSKASSLTCEAEFNLDGTDEEKVSCFKDLKAALPSGADAECRQAAAAAFYAADGGFLFLGLFLGLLFLMATALIIYYKQISEGYEDQRRFSIMQKVGMSEQEVRRSIRGQILLVFFLPLGMAAVHILAAFHMITRLLVIFSLTNVGLFALCTLGTLAVFGALYVLVYWATARTYYKIVRAG